MAEAVSGREHAGLAVHRVIGGVLNRDRQKRAGTDVESDETPLDAARVDGPQQAVGEMEAGGRRGDGALAPCIHGLVVIAVAGVCGPTHVGRQRHGTVALKRLGERRAAAVEDQAHLGAVPRLDVGGEISGEAHCIALSESPRGLGKR